MAIMDPIADMFTRIRNALIAKHDSVDIPFSKIKLEIAKILKSEGFVVDVTTPNEDLVKRVIRVSLKYNNGKSVISVLNRVSKPSKRIYVEKKSVPKPLNGFGLSIISTSKGVLSGRDARLKNVGGELIGIVY